MSSSKNQPKATAQKTELKVFERFERGTLEIEHHLLKLKVSPMRKNMSWIYRSPTIVEIEHTHFFHSINDTTMKPNRFSSPTGGHFHEVILEVDADGNMTAKCGPAVQFVNRKVAGGRMVKRIERVKWERYNENPSESILDSEELDAELPANNEAEVITEFDSHTHELEYLGSEKFNSQSKTELRKQETAKVRGLMEGPASRQPGAMNKLQNQPGSEEARRVLVEGPESTKG